MRKTTVVIATIFSLIVSFIAVAPAVAASCSDTGCSGCTSAKIDLGCQRARLFTPQSTTAKNCTLYFCADGGVTAPNSGSDLSFNVFGVSIRINTDAGIYALLFLAFNLFLGIVATALVIIGVRAAIKRARADSDDEVASAGKTLQNSVIGLGIIILSLLIVQIVANLVGVGSVADLVNFSVIGK